MHPDVIHHCTAVFVAVVLTNRDEIFDATFIAPIIIEMTGHRDLIHIVVVHALFLLVLEDFIHICGMSLF